MALRDLSPAALFVGGEAAVHLSMTVVAQAEVDAGAMIVEAVGASIAEVVGVMIEEGAVAAPEEVMNHLVSGGVVNAVVEVATEE